MMARRLGGFSALLVVVASVSPALSASLINNAVRISPALQFHSVSPDAIRFPDQHSLGDINVTKPIDKGTSKVMTRRSLSDINVTKHIDKGSSKLMTRKRSVRDITVTKHIDKGTSKLMTRSEPAAPSPVPVPYPNIGAQQ
jgi:type VI protein secretion system component Hcp